MSRVTCDLIYWVTTVNNQGKFRPGIALMICTDQIHLPKNCWQKPETGIKDGFKSTSAGYKIASFHFRS